MFSMFSILDRYSMRMRTMYSNNTEQELNELYLNRKAQTRDIDDDDEEEGEGTIKLNRSVAFGRMCELMS